MLCLPPNLVQPVITDGKSNNKVAKIPFRCCCKCCCFWEPVAKVTMCNQYLKHFANETISLASPDVLCASSLLHEHLIRLILRQRVPEHSGSPHLVAHKTQGEKGCCGATVTYRHQAPCFPRAGAFLYLPFLAGTRILRLVADLLLLYASQWGLCIIGLAYFIEQVTPFMRPCDLLAPYSL